MNRKPRASKLLGKEGEQKACDYLLQHNYTILEKNFRHKRLEIDIIALDRKEDELVFVEVKTRSSNKLEQPVSALSNQQLQRLITAAQIYLEKRQLNKAHRFDIIGILPQKVEHLKNITVDW